MSTIANEVPFSLLLIDDEPTMLSTIRDCLRESELNISSAMDAADGLSLARQDKFDLILLDVGLPDANGFEVLRILKSDPQLQTIPVIMLTAWNSIDDKVEAFQLGAADYITKPFEVMELRARMMATLRTKQLQDQLSQANRDLDAARQAAESATRAKSEFLANMSHEIRTPMNGVIAMTSLLMESELSSSQRELVTTIRNSGDALLEIINDILDFSKIEAGKMELENQPFELRPCIEDALDLLAPRAVEKKLELSYQMDDDVPPMVIGDITRVRQVLVNLVGNAIKFTQRGEVIVRLRRAAEDSPTVRTLQFSVSDTGIGIPPERLNRLFQSFSQVDASTTRKFGGSGLGLAICRSLTTLMGGKISVESVPDRGSTFHFSIPFEATTETGASAVEQSSRLAGLRMLIVDDNETNRRILTLQCQKWGLHSRAAASGLEALPWLQRGEPFDVAILDMQMPEMDGLQLAQEIRRYRSPQALPLVLLTSMGLGSQANESLAVFAACVSKPVKPAQLHSILLQTMEGTKQAASLPGTAQALDTGLAAWLPLRLLLVDDNAINQKVAVRLLDQMGYRTDVASNGLEAVQAVNLQNYDLILMDVQMPEMDGLTATRGIRELEKSINRPAAVIIAMTANAMKGDRERCLEAGMNDYLAKPVRPQQLQEVLVNWGAKIHGTADLPAAKKAGPGAALGAEAAPPVDMERLNEFSSGDADTLNELITLYFDQTDGQMVKLKAAIDAQEIREVQRIAHSCVGSSATCGMVAAVPIFRQLEEQSHEGTLANAAKLYDQGIRELKRMREFLSQNTSS